MLCNHSWSFWREKTVNVLSLLFPPLSWNEIGATSWQLRLLQAAFSLKARVLIRLSTDVSSLITAKEGEH